MKNKSERIMYKPRQKPAKRPILSILQSVHADISGRAKSEFLGTN